MPVWDVVWSRYNKITNCILCMQHALHMICLNSLKAIDDHPISSLSENVQNCSTNQRHGNGRNTEESDQIPFGLGSSIMSLPKLCVSPTSSLSPNAQRVLENIEALEQQWSRAKIYPCQGVAQWVHLPLIYGENLYYWTDQNLPLILCGQNNQKAH